jgi:hypothetical protein
MYEIKEMYKNMFDAFREKVKDLQEKDLQGGTSRGSLSIQQTQRNNEKAELVEALYEGFKGMEEEMGVQVYITKGGPIIEILNPQVENQVISKDKNDICNGMISLEVDLKVKNLDYDGSIEQKNYLFEKEQKEEKRLKKEEARLRKIQRDAQVRAEKKRLRDQQIEKYMVKEDEDKE